MESFLKEFWDANSNIRLLGDLHNWVVSVCAKFEGCAAKTVGGVGLLRVTGFSKKHYCEISSHGCQFDGSDFKLGTHVKKWSLMLHYMFNKVWKSVLEGRALLMWKFGGFDI